MIAVFCFFVVTNSSEEFAGFSHLRLGISPQAWALQSFPFCDFGDCSTERTGLFRPLCFISLLRTTPVNINGTKCGLQKAGDTEEKLGHLGVGRSCITVPVWGNMLLQRLAFHISFGMLHAFTDCFNLGYIKITCFLPVAFFLAFYIAFCCDMNIYWLKIFI